MSHIFCCANISKHKYKLYARSSRTRSEIIGIIRPISTHRHSFVHQGRLAIFFQSQPDFSIHRRFCLKRYAITSSSWHINHLIKLRRPRIGKCSWDIGNKALFSSVNGICTPVFCPSRPACKIVHEIAICYNIIRKRNECYIIKRYRMLHVLTSFYIAQEKEQFCTAAGNRRCKIISVRLPFWCRGKSAIKQSRIVDSLYANCNRSTHRTLCTERNAVGRRAVNINILIELGRPCVWKRRVNICLQSRISSRKDGAIFTPCRPACIVRCKVGVLKIYRNRENLGYCKERGIRLSGPALGRPKKGEERNKVQDYRDECERVEVERKFSLGKRKCGMGLVTAKLEETAAHVVALSILLLNLRKIQCAFLQFWDWLLGFLQPCEKQMVIQ